MECLVGKYQNPFKYTRVTPNNYCTMTSMKRIYERSGRHSEPITAQNPGVKCPPMSYSDAQKILDSAERVGNTLQATHAGVGYVARRTRITKDGEIWHGYPEAWDKMNLNLKKRWLKQGLIKRRDIRKYKSREKVRDAFGGRYVGG